MSTVSAKVPGIVVATDRKDGQTRSSFVRNVATVLGAQFACAVLSLATETVYARLLGPAGRGQISLCLMSITVGVLLGNLGGETPMILWAANPKKHVSEWLPTLFATGGSGVVLSTILWAIIYWVWHPRFLHGITSSQALLVLMTIPVSIAFGFCIALISGREEFRRRSKALITYQGVLLLAAFLLIAFFRQSTEMALVANLLGLLAGLGLLVFSVRKFIDGPLNFGGVRTHVGPALSLGARAVTGNLATFLNYRFDVFIVNYFLDATQVGLYALGVLVSESLWQIPHAAAVSLLPRTARTMDQGNEVFTCSITRHVFAIACVSAALIALLSPLAIPMVFGERFRPSIMVIWWILPGTVALAVAKVMAADLVARGKPEYASIFSMVTLAATIALDFLLIPRMGILGAALASSIAYLANTVLIAWALRRELKVKITEILLPTQAEFAVYRQVYRRVFFPASETMAPR